MAISPALRGIYLILALLDQQGWLLERSTTYYVVLDKCETQPGCYLTGQVVAAYCQVRLWPTHQLVGVARYRSLFVATPLSGFRVLARRSFGEGRVALHLGIFDQPE